jgi:hypothetical protein
MQSKHEVALDPKYPNIEKLQETRDDTLLPRA